MSVGCSVAAFATGPLEEFGVLIKSRSRGLIGILFLAISSAWTLAAAPTTPSNPSPGSPTSPGPLMPSTTVNLSWTASSGATYYDLGVTDMSSGSLVVDTTVYGTSYTAYLSAGKQYRWNVAACNSTGCSAYTTRLYFQTPSPPPGSFTLSNQAPVCDTNQPVGPAVRLNWTAASGATTYEVYRNGSQIASGVTGTTFYNSTGLTAGQSYSYFVRARNSAGATDSGAINVSIPNNICVGPLVDGAVFVSETIPDSTQFAPSQSFTKSWTIRNSGATTWNSSYSLQYVSSAGGSFCGHSAVAVNGTVASNSTHVFSINCTAPSTAGTYQENWRLVGPSGTILVGMSNVVWVRIVVSDAGNKLTLGVQPLTQQREPGQIASMNVTVLSSGLPVVGATVPVVDSLCGISTQLTTTNGGTASYACELPGNVVLGSYPVTFGPASKGGYVAGGTVSATVMVTQASQCTFTTTPASLSVQAAGEDGIIAVQTQSGCTWSASSQVDWASFLTQPPAAGSGTVAYRIRANGTTGTRTGSLLVAGRPVRVDQSGSLACRPAITGVVRRFSGRYLPSVDVEYPVEADIAWCGGLAGTVRFQVSGREPSIVTPAGPKARRTFNLSRDFQVGYAPSTITLTPIAADGAQGPAWTEQVVVYPWPDWLSAQSEIDLRHDELEITGGIEWPYPHAKPSITFPSWMPYVGDTSVGLTETYVEALLGMSSAGTGVGFVEGATGFKAAGGIVSGKLTGEVTATVAPTGFEVIGTAGFEIEGTIESSLGIVEAIPALASLENTPLIGEPVRWLNDRAKLKGELSPFFKGTFGFARAGGDWQLRGGSIPWGIEAKGTLIVDVFPGLTARGWVAGRGEVESQFSQPYVRTMELTLQPGVELNVWNLWNTELTHTYGCWYQFESGWDCRTSGDTAQSAGPEKIRRAAVSTVDLPLKTIVPKFSRYGEYSRFDGGQRGLKKAAPIRRAAVADGGALLQNIFPGATPSLVRAGAAEVLLWAHQNPDLPVPQSTDIAWSVRTPTGWTQPQRVLQDTRLELAPVAGVDGNSRVVAAWLRIKDTAYQGSVQSTVDLARFYSRLEVVTAAFDPILRTWSAVTGLTDDDLIDENLQLASDAAGNLLLTWLSRSPEQPGSGTPNSTLKYARWTGSAWTQPSTVTGNFGGVSGYSTAVSGQSAAILVARDPDATRASDGLLELYRWGGSGWLGPTIFASGGGDNHLPALVFDSAGTCHVVWARGGDLVFATVANPVPQRLRPDSQSLAFFSTKLYTNSAGNLTIVWQQSVDNGSANFFGRVFDPRTSNWSSDLRLNELPGLSHAASGYYDESGRLHLAYLQSSVERTPQTVVVGGRTMVVPNVPSMGRADLMLLDHTLATDLGLADQDLTLSPARPTPGQAAVATVVVDNTGSFAVPSFGVNLYAGGTLVGSVQSTTTLLGGETRSLMIPFTYPNDGGDVSAVVNEDGAVSELTSANNRAVIHLSNHPPNAVNAVNPTSGLVPLTVEFDASATSDADGDAFTCSWLFPDGNRVDGACRTAYTFTQPGTYSVLLRVRDSRGAEATRQVVITALAENSARFTVDGVVDSASYTAGLSPGGLVSLFGTNLSNLASGVLSAERFPLPTEMAGTIVSVNGVLAPLLAVAKLDGLEQINFQVPYEISAPGTARIMVSKGGQPSAAVETTVLPAHPGIFIIPDAGPAVTHSSGQLLTRANPARPGEVLVIYCSGLGAVAPSVTAGSPAPAEPLARSLVEPVVMISGKESRVEYSGLTPGLAGLYQINAVVPLDAATGDSIPITVYSGGVRSNTVNIPVAP